MEDWEKSNCRFCVAYKADNLGYSWDSAEST